MEPEELIRDFKKVCDMSEGRDHDHDRDDEEIRYTRHTPKWWETWVNPTTVMVLFGAIVWGVQLNFSVLQNTKEIGYLGSSQAKILEIQQEMVVQNTKIWVILERINKSQDRMDTAARALSDRLQELEVIQKTIRP